MFIKVSDCNLIQNHLYQLRLLEIHHKEYKNFGTNPTSLSLVKLIWKPKGRNKKKKSSLSEFSQHKSLKHLLVPADKKQNKYNSPPCEYLMGHGDIDTCFSSQILYSSAHSAL